MSVILTLALLLALGFSAYRVLGRARLQRELAKLPGAAPASALEIDEFRAIEEHLSRRHCACGGTLRSMGERSERTSKRLLRVAAVECNLCEKRDHIYFDVTRIYH